VRGELASRSFQWTWQRTGTRTAWHLLSRAEPGVAGEAGVTSNTKHILVLKSDAVNSDAAVAIGWATGSHSGSLRRLGSELLSGPGCLTPSRVARAEAAAPWLRRVTVAVPAGLHICAGRSESWWY
jgi:hypothetical protein